MCFLLAITRDARMDMKIVFEIFCYSYWKLLSSSVPRIIIRALSFIKIELILKCWRLTCRILLTSMIMQKNLDVLVAKKKNFKISSINLAFLSSPMKIYRTVTLIQNLHNFENFAKFYKFSEWSTQKGFYWNTSKTESQV